MEDHLMVRSASQGRFVDQVVSHAARHLILSEIRRRELVKDAVALHAVLCQELRMNPMATGEALKAAQFLHNLISLGLEIVSVQNVAVAVRALAEQPLAALVELAKKRLKAVMSRVIEYRRSAVVWFELTDMAGTREYALAYGRDLETLAALQGSTVLADLVRTVISALIVQGVKTPWAQSTAEGVLYEKCAAHDLLRALEDFLDRAEEELRISKQCLPWRELCAEAGFSPLLGQISTSDLTLHWGIDSLLSTLAITLRLPGRGRRKTMLSWDTFHPYIARLETAEFRAQSLMLLQKYWTSRKPAPSTSELGILRELAQWAFDQLAVYAPHAESAQQATSWTERVHLKLETASAGRSLREHLLGDVEPGDEEEKKPAKVRLGELARIATELGEEKEEALRAMLVNDLDWSSVRTEEDLVKLGEVVPPDLLARYMLLEARLVHHVVMAEDGWTEWSATHQQMLIGRLLKAGQDAPWISLAQKGNTVLQEIFSQATPAQARQLRKLWVRIKIWR